MNEMKLIKRYTSMRLPYRIYGPSWRNSQRQYTKHVIMNGVHIATLCMKSQVASVRYVVLLSGGRAILCVNIIKVYMWAIYALFLVEILGIVFLYIAPYVEPYCEPADVPE